MRNKIYCLLILLLPMQLTGRITDEDFQAMVTEVQQLKAENTNLATQLETLNQELKTVTSAEKQRTTEKNLHLKELQNSLEAARLNLLMWFLGVFGLVTIGGAIFFIFTLPKMIRNRATEIVDAEIAKLVKKRKSVLVDLIKENNLENQLVASKKIFFQGENEHDKIIDLLLLHGFEEQNLISNSNQKKDCDIIFINNTKGDFFPRNADETTVKSIGTELKNESKDKCFFYYNENGIRFDIGNDELKYRINFATNPAQIYGNLVNLLKYQDKLKDGIR